ncbi:MAG: hypothetical protein ABWY93_18630 [Mycobacterium sp.]
MSDTRWRVFAGEMDDRLWVYLDQGGLTWQRAHELMTAAIMSFTDSECDDCREAAFEYLCELDDPCAPNAPFFGELDGDQYVIMTDTVENRCPTSAGSSASKPNSTTVTTTWSHS